jgi:uncharacterized protein YkwD
MKAATLALVSAAAIAAPARPDLEGVESLAVRHTNEFRADNRLPAVKPDASLARTAREFAQYMARTDRYGHEADGRTPGDRARAHGYDACIVAENIAYQLHSEGFGTAMLASGFVAGWKHSPEHRRNMLDDAVTQTAVAVARSERTGRYYAVQMFGRPKSERIEFRVANKASQHVRFVVGVQ